MKQIIRKGNGGVPVLSQNCAGDLEYLTFPALEETGMVGHLFSTRMGGVSEGIYSTMNLSFTRGDEITAVMENYRRIAEVLQCPVERMVASHQTHTTNIRIVTEEDCGKGIVRERDYEDVDGLVTDQPGICLVTYFADCVPLYFVDPVKHAIGLAHSGWRGTVNRMGECMVRTLQEVFGSDPADIVAAIGPSICADCYEVSEDVAQEFLERFEEEAIVTEGKKPGKYQLDLWLANKSILVQAGIPKEHIFVTDICTCHNPDYLFSHRASQGKRGNLAAFLYILNDFSEKA